MTKTTNTIWMIVLLAVFSCTAEDFAGPISAEVQAVKDYIRAGWPGTIRTT